MNNKRKPKRPQLEPWKPGETVISDGDIDVRANWASRSLVHISAGIANAAIDRMMNK
jgi:hypothetical protein